MRTQSMTLKATTLTALALLALGTNLAACDDTPKEARKEAPKPQATPSTVADRLKAPEIPAGPAPVAATPPSAAITPEVKKDEPPPIVKGGDSDDDEIPSLTELLSRTRKALAAGETDRALKLAALAVQKAPNRSSSWNLLGRAQLQAGKRKLALTSFEKAVELNPGNSYAQNNLGLTLIYDKRYDDAIEALEAATDLKPVEGYMWNNLGMAYEHADRLDDARDAYGKAAEMENDNARESLARLEGVKSVIRTAKVDSDTAPGKPQASTHQ